MLRTKASTTAISASIPRVSFRTDNLLLPSFSKIAQQNGASWAIENRNQEPLPSPPLQILNYLPKPMRKG